jgi:hypothetical protein
MQNNKGDVDHITEMDRIEIRPTKNVKET